MCSRTHSPPNSLLANEEESIYGRSKRAAFGQLMAFILAGLTLIISLFMHDFWGMEEGLQRAHEMQNFVKNMAIMAGLLYVAGVTPAAKK